MNEAAPRWPIKATRYSCGARDCGASVMLTIIDPLPSGWGVVTRGTVPKNWAGGSTGRIADGKCGYVCGKCALAAADAEGGPR